MADDEDVPLTALCAIWYAGHARIVVSHTLTITATLTQSNTLALDAAFSPAL